MRHPVNLLPRVGAARSQDWPPSAVGSQEHADRVRADPGVALPWLRRASGRRPTPLSPSRVSKKLPGCGGLKRSSKGAPGATCAVGSEGARDGGLARGACGLRTQLREWGGIIEIPRVQDGTREVSACQRIRRLGPAGGGGGRYLCQHGLLFGALIGKQHELLRAIFDDAAEGERSTRMRIVVTRSAT